MNLATRNILINVLWFYLGWFLCVIYGNGMAIMVLAGSILVYRFVIPFTIKQWQFVLAVVLAGLVVDSFLIGSKVITFHHLGIFPPLWLATLWLLFGTALLVSLPMIVRKKWLFLCLCGLGGPGSYAGGVELGAAEFGYEWLISFTALAVVWVIVGCLIRAMHIIMFGAVTSEN